MDKDKSILERFTDTVKEMASSASEALKVEEPPRVEQSNIPYVPLAAEGLVSDPLVVPPIAAQPPRRKRAARKTAKTSARKSSPKNSPARKAATKRASPKKARKAAKPARGKSRAASRSAAKASARRTTTATGKNKKRGTTRRRTSKGGRR